MAFGISEREALHASCRRNHPLNRMHEFSHTGDLLHFPAQKQNFVQGNVKDFRICTQDRTALELVLSHYSDWVPVVTIKAWSELKRNIFTWYMGYVKCSNFTALCVILKHILETSGNWTQDATSD